MKVTIEIDCTPLEAREFLGLPNVQHIQAAMMDQMQERMTSTMEKFSPEALIQNWFTFDPKMAARAFEMFGNFTGPSTTRKE